MEVEWYDLDALTPEVNEQVLIVLSENASLATWDGNDFRWGKSRVRARLWTPVPKLPEPSDD